MILAAATGAPPAGGAPLSQVIGATAAGMLLTAALLVIGHALPGQPDAAARRDRRAVRMAAARTELGGAAGRAGDRHR